MKTNRVLLLATFLLFPWCASQLLSQQDGDKKIVITKRTIEANGAEISETIVKKGAAAKGFDVDKYISENRADNNQVEVKVTEGDDEHIVVVKGSKMPSVNHEEVGYDNDSGEAGLGINYYTAGDNGAFLGVNEDSDERSDQPGLVVNVVRGSAADQAGLRDNDKIMKLNDSPTNQWIDLSKFVQSAKAGDKVRVSYERNGKAAIAEAILSKRDDVKNVLKNEPKAFLGVSDDEDSEEKDEAGVEVTITRGSGAEKAGLQNGDVIFQLGDAPISDFEDISDYMAYARPGEKVMVTYERNGKRNTVDATLSEQKNTWKVNSEDWDLGNWDAENLNENEDISSKGNCTVNVRAKDACLGVFSDAYAEGSATGSRVNDFTDESAAREANMEKGDLITAVNNQPIKNHDELWNEISKNKIGDKVKVDYLRSGKILTAEVTLKACRDNSSKVEILDNDGEQVRNFTSWNWSDDDQRNLRERSVITIRKGEGDAQKVNTNSNGQAIAQDRSLVLTDFSATPNPEQSQITIAFTGDPVATTVSFFDLAGRQLFREELNAFGGQYSQQFDLKDYTKGSIMVQVQQGDKVFTEQMMVN